MAQDAAPQGFGERVRERRRGLRHADGRRWSQTDLANAVGVTTNTVSEWERGRRPKDPAVVTRLAQVLGVEVGWLLADERRRALADAFVSYGPTEPLAWPQRARQFAHDFVAEAVRHGASEEEANFIRRTLLAPEAYVLFHGGRKHEMSGAEMLREMEGLAKGLRIWLREREKRRHGE